MKTLYKISIVIMTIFLLTINVTFSTNETIVDNIKFSTKTEIASATEVQDPIKYFDLRYWICWKLGNYSQCVE